MLTGAHIVVASKDPEADYAFFRDILNLGSIDGGGGYLIFGLPASEFSVHQSDGPVHQHELHLLCDDIDAFVKEMANRGVPCSQPEDAGWGLVVKVTLPSGAPLSIYQPRHARPRS
jgi:hypothetical protein